MNEPGRAEQTDNLAALAARRDERGTPEGATEGSTGTGSAGYVIAVAAARAGVHEQTLRHYERLGLISPARKGTRPRSPRLYSERDIGRVIQIRRLIVDLGVNLAGVEIILGMRERMESLQQELRQLRRRHEDALRDLALHQNEVRRA